MSNCITSNPKDLKRKIRFQLQLIAQEYNITLPSDGDHAGVFQYLVMNLGKRNSAVVLIDEYDAPISENILKENIEEIGQVLSDFYLTIKSCNEYIHFSFITGVTRYTKLSLFSKMNNLKDISMLNEYSAMFGYTQKELEDTFYDYINDGIYKTGLTKDSYINKIKMYYDGYCFSPKGERIYNPVSIGEFFFNGSEDFRNYWSDTGNPKLLIDIAKLVDFSIFDLKEPLDYESLSTFNLMELSSGNMDINGIKNLMFQTGYLTIKNIDQDNLIYLDFPNIEVARSFSLRFLESYISKLHKNNISIISNRAIEALNNGDTDKAISIIKTIFASFSYDSVQRERRSEAFWQSCLYFFFIGAQKEKIISEYSTNNGRIDLILELKTRIFIIELKLDKNAVIALSQIKERKYYETFLNQEKKVHLLGINFSSIERNIQEWKEEIVNNK